LTVLGVDMLTVGAGMPCDACLAGSLVADRPESDRVVTARVDVPAVCWAAADIWGSRANLIGRSGGVSRRPIGYLSLNV
jgi:hypothetical protein